MRGLFLGKPVLLGAVAVTTAVLGMWCTTSEALPGEKVADVVAATLRGGDDDCWSISGSPSCNDVAGQWCDKGETVKCSFQAMMFIVGGTKGNLGWKPAGNLLCCGLGPNPTSCAPGSTQLDDCGTTTTGPPPPP